jgi:hypothetical protein
MPLFIASVHSLNTNICNRSCGNLLQNDIRYKPASTQRLVDRISMATRKRNSGKKQRFLLGPSHKSRLVVLRDGPNRKRSFFTVAFTRCHGNVMNKPLWDVWRRTSTTTTTTTFWCVVLFKHWHDDAFVQYLNTDINKKFWEELIISFREMPRSVWWLAGAVASANITIFTCTVSHK